MMRRPEVLRSGLRLPVLALASSVLLAPVPAFAHASLVRSNPADGAVLDTPPTHVQARFDCEIGGDSRMILLDAAGQRIEGSQGSVDLDDPDRASMLMSPSSLPAGRYFVHWTAIGALDGHAGHATEGEFSFEVK